MINTATLLSPNQHTLAAPTAWVSGTTLRNHAARMRFLPAPANAGRHIRITEKGHTTAEFPITLQGSKNGPTWTDALDPATGRGVGVIEHPAAAVVLAGLDNVVLEIDYPNGRPRTLFYAAGKRTSIALTNGTAAPYLTAIAKVGIVQQPAKRLWHHIKTPVHATFGNSSYTLTPRTAPGWSFNITIPPHSAKWRLTQQSGLTYDLTQPNASQILNTIATARPASYGTADWLAFRALTLGTTRKADFAVIFSPFTNQPLHNQAAYGDAETVHHQHLDLLGDILFFTGYLQADITVSDPFHKTSNQFRHWLLKSPHVWA